MYYNCLLLASGGPASISRSASALFPGYQDFRFHTSFPFQHKILAFRNNRSNQKKHQLYAADLIILICSCWSAEQEGAAAQEDQILWWGDEIAAHSQASPTQIWSHGPNATSEAGPNPAVFTGVMERFKNYCSPLQPRCKFTRSSQEPPQQWHLNRLSRLLCYQLLSSTTKNWPSALAAIRGLNAPPHASLPTAELRNNARWIYDFRRKIAVARGGTWLCYLTVTQG